MKIQTRRKEINGFIDDLSKKLNKKKVKFILAPCSFVQDEDGIRSNGYFGGDPAELAISIGKPLKQWLPSLVHESCHFDQWSTGSKLWKAHDKLEATSKSVYDWLVGTELKKPEIKIAIDTLRELELDCDRRALVKITQLGLPIDPIVYAKNASAYAYFHNYVALKRKWYVIGREPFNNAKILALMPGNLNSDYLTLPKKLIPLFDECV